MCNLPGWTIQLVSTEFTSVVQVKSNYQLKSKEWHKYEIKFRSI